MRPQRQLLEVPRPLRFVPRTGIVLRVRGLWGILGVPFMSGCSFMFMQAPPENHSKLRYFDCVSSTAAPVTDTTNAAINGLALAFAGVGSDDAEPSAALLFGGVAALHAASAIYGFVSAAGCNSAKQSLADRIHQREAEDARRIDALEQQLKSPRGGCSSDANCICAGSGCNSPAPKVEPLPLTPAVPEAVPESAPQP